MMTGERQSGRMRIQYLQAMLNQDVGYFDIGTSTGEIVASISADTALVQDAISEKVRAVEEKNPVISCSNHVALNCFDSALDHVTLN
jgi:ABC-type multidrug transport system fused ATPase/permease subunit